MSFREGDATSFHESWPRWLVRRFGDDPRAISDGIGCTQRQALNYINGNSLPSGRLLARVMRSFPSDIPQILGAADA